MTTSERIAAAIWRGCIATMEEEIQLFEHDVYALRRGCSQMHEAAEYCYECEEGVAS